MIDWKRIEELKDEVGAEDFVEVAAIFLEEVDEVVDRLRENPNLETMEADMHFLKGSALNLGFDALSVYCQAGEKAASNDDAATIDLSQLFEIYDASKAEFLRVEQIEFAA
ncbi:Hpt domain-containing protein [Cochlodiniinecator piscidefendens]|uniref:Hpt domain-containing protein n=1 Tax=Cochlodiniinecator piscidefendens TaxID=2715756 RepID=UPI00140BE2CD|nr:Hpt domain-containing protein [Cochlodiniinecator piscidefendens]